MNRHSLSISLARFLKFGLKSERLKVRSDETVTDQASKNNVDMPGSADWESRTRRRLTRVLVRRERKEDCRTIGDTMAYYSCRHFASSIGTTEDGILCSVHIHAFRFVNCTVIEDCKVN